jgi:hypothetical protein
MVAPTVDPQTRNAIVYVDLGPPLQAVAADQAKEVLPRLGHRAHGGRASGDRAVVGREHLGLRETHFLGLEARLGGGEPGDGRLLGGGSLRGRLRTDETLGRQVASTGGIAPGLGQDRPGFGDRRARLSHVGGDRFRIDARQRLAAAHPIADVDQHFDDAKAGQLPAYHGFLPGGDVALGDERPRPVFALQRDQRYRQRRTRRCFLFRIGRRRPGGSARKQRPQREADRREQQQARQRPGGKPVL